MTAEYERETVIARLECLREERGLITDFKREIETLLKKIGQKDVELGEEIQEFIDKYGQEKCLKYNLPLLLVQKIASKELRTASREWDVK